MSSPVSALSNAWRPCTQSENEKLVRPTAKYHPNVWGDYFLQVSHDENKLDSWRKKTKELKDQVLHKLISTKEGTVKLELIDKLYKLGVSYHFDKEIEQELENLYKTYDEDAPKENLYYLSLRFRLLRKNGWNVSSDAFYMFKEAKDGSFKESIASDFVGMLSLYEACYVGTKEDKILDEAIIFATTKLRSSLTNIKDPILAERVKRSLELPLHKRLQRLEVTYFISIYEKETGHDKYILDFAKMDYNILQALHQNEIKEITRWWKNIGLEEKIHFARNRVTEAYFWPLGAHFGPEYSRTRILTTKILSIIIFVDDFYDAYGIEEEHHLFTHAVNRWDMEAIETLPHYVKPLYEALLNFFEEMGKEYSQSEGGEYRVSYLKQAVKDLCREYLTESKWCSRGFIPSVEEFMRCALITSVYPTIICSFLALGPVEMATKDIMDWIMSFPKYVQDSSCVSRILGDTVSYTFQQERTHVASIVECYAKEHKCSEVEAVSTLRGNVMNIWKDMNKACFRPTPIPMTAMEVIKNLARVIEVVYRFEDGLTFSNGKTKEYIAILLKEPIPLI